MSDPTSHDGEDEPPNEEVPLRTKVEFLDNEEPKSAIKAESPKQRRVSSSLLIGAQWQNRAKVRETRDYSISVSFETFLNL